MMCFLVYDLFERNDIRQVFFCALLSTNKLTAKDKLIDIVCETQYSAINIVNLNKGY